MENGSLPPTDYTHKQQEMVAGLHDPAVTFIISIGAMGSGKTWGAVRSFMDWSLPLGGRFIVASYQERKVLDTLLPEITEHMLLLGYERESRKIVSDHPEEKLFSSNANGLYTAKCEYTWHHGENKNAWESIVGMNASGALLDECVLLDDRFIRQVVTRCRIGEPKIIMCGNPQSKSHPFYRNWWANPALESERVQIVSALSDNPHLTAKYVARQAALKSGDEYLRDIEGLWTDTAFEPIYAGKYEVSSLPAGEPRRHWAALDYARVGVNAAILIADYGADGWWVSDEWLFDSSLYKDNSAAAIPAIADNFVEWLDGRASAVAVDPTSNRDFKSEIRRRGIHAIAADNDREVGVRTTLWYLETGEVRIASNCSMTIQSLQRAEYDPDQIENGKFVPLKRGPMRDHHADALRYFCATADATRATAQKQWATVN